MKHSFLKLLYQLMPTACMLFPAHKVFSQRWSEVYRIQPDVSRSSVAYPYIVLHRYDTILITAGGCVQTGGKGKTWKRYINPIGPNAIKKDPLDPDQTRVNSLYLSSFTIKGFTSNLLADYINHPLIMPETVNNAIFTLGYSDDDYSDNGYDKRNNDDGTENQCKGLGNAFVIVKIKRFKQ